MVYRRNFDKIPWWERQTQYPMWFWCDPWSEVRVSETHGRQRYFFTNPTDEQEILLKEKWEKDNDVYATSSKVIAEETLGLLNLPLPDWNSNYCYRVYWREFVYYI